MIRVRNEDKLSIKTYIFGTIITVALTFGSYFLVTNEIISGTLALITISIFAIMQFIVQSVLFLHVGMDKKPKFHTAIFLYIIMTILILVLCSMWIMYNLDYRHDHDNSTPDETNYYLLEEENYH
ncbi:MAG: hypothetical protein U0451_00710 [Candidatus Saccharimonadales bacterium]